MRSANEVSDALGRVGRIAKRGMQATTSAMTDAARTVGNQVRDVYADATAPAPQGQPAQASTKAVTYQVRTTRLRLVRALVDASAALLDLSSADGEAVRCSLPAWQAIVATHGLAERELAVIEVAEFTDDPRREPTLWRDARGDDANLPWRLVPATQPMRGWVEASGMLGAASEDTRPSLSFDGLWLVTSEFRKLVEDLTSDSEPIDHMSFADLLAARLDIYDRRLAEAVRNDRGLA